MAIQLRQAGKKLPNRILMYGKPGSCKTTFGAFTPRPVFILTPNETGLDTLVEQKLAPACDAYEVKTWGDYLEVLRAILKSDAKYLTLNIDTLNGLVNLCFEEVCRNQFGNDMGRFLDFGKGPEVSLPTWNRQFPLLDEIREKKGMMIVQLAHSGVKPVKNPGGENYDRFIPLVHEKLAHTITAWADITLFIHRTPITRKDGMKHKAVGMNDLQIVTSEQPFCDAKNRANLPEFIDIESQSPAAVFNEFKKAMIAAKAANNAASEAKEPTKEVPTVVVKEPTPATPAE